MLLCSLPEQLFGGGKRAEGARLGVQGKARKRVVVPSGFAFGLATTLLKVKWLILKASMIRTGQATRPGRSQK